MTFDIQQHRGNWGSVSEDTIPTLPAIYVPFGTPGILFDETGRAVLDETGDPILLAEFTCD